jgi:hypothetical protein
MQSMMKTSTLLANTTFRMMYLRSAAFAASSSSSGKGKKDASLGQEKDFVNKQEQQLLKNLLKKVKEQAEKTSLSEDKKAEVAAQELKDLCAAHKIKHSDSLIKDLVAWKKE